MIVRPQVYLACPGVGPHVRSNVAALSESGHLSRFATTFINHPDSRLANLLRKVSRRLDALVAKRIAPPGVEWSKVRTRPMFELLRSYSSIVIKNASLTHRIWSFSQGDFDRWAARLIRPEDDIVYLYEQCGLRTAERAKALGKFVAFEQISQHPAYLKMILESLQCDDASRASLNDTIEMCQPDKPWNKQRDQEAKLADALICNSSFTRRTLIHAGYDELKIHVLPLGCPEVGTPRSQPQKTIFLHAGTESIRKGTHLLYKAWDSIAHRSDVELWFAGGRSFVGSEGLNLPGNAKRLGSLSHSSLMDRMTEASALVLPTLADGFGLVVTEALSRGLPVITTDAAGAADLLVSRQAGGIVIPAGDVEHLTEAMAWCADHPAELFELGQQGRQIAANWSWSHYQQAYIELLCKLTAATGRPQERSSASR